MTPETFINSSSGNHWNGMDNRDVIGICAKDKNVKYFPKGLESIFENLRAINIENSRIKELHQSDLKRLENLMHLDLARNYIET